jgi:hypothetical protein
MRSWRTLALLDEAYSWAATAFAGPLLIGVSSAGAAYENV